MANMTKASINTFCMLTLGPWPSMQAALPSLPQWALGILGGHKVQETSLGPRTVSREPHMRCRPIRRSNCTPQWTGKSRLQSLSKAPWKLNVARLVSALVSPQIRNGRQFPSKGRIYNISYIYISKFISYHIIFISYTSKFIPDRLDYLRHASRVSRIGSLKPIKHNSRTPAFCDRRFFHSRDRQASGREFAALKLSSPPKKIVGA